ncbi:hypothetical protein HanRHA438_Chr15g0734281 [Helianthus annuus]|nr:hypothetical protein HanRHA438_Chr15g0734281 [Helianthus annuus]
MFSSIISPHPDALHSRRPPPKDPCSPEGQNPRSTSDLVHHISVTSSSATTGYLLSFYIIMTCVAGE